MNLNDCINRLPLILRGRFSSSSNASWLAWASDCMAKIERVSVGPGNKRKVLGWQMPGGFVPLPAGLRQITDAWLDGEQVQGLKSKNDKGFKLEDEVTFKRVSCMVSASEFTSEVQIDSLSGEFPNHRKVTVNVFNVSPKNGAMELESGSEFPAGTNTMVGWVIWINGEELHITSSSANATQAAFTVSESSSQVITDAIPGQDLAGVTADALAGCEVHSGNDVVTISTSSWVVPSSTPAGWSVSLDFLCDRGEPGRTFDWKTGHILQSNLVIEGYRSLARPTTLTEELDLPPGCEDLMASYLRWAAEHDQDNGSGETAKARLSFENNLRQYGIDQSRTNGATRPTAYQFTPALGMRTR